MSEEINIDEVLDYADSLDTLSSNDFDDLLILLSLDEVTSVQLSRLLATNSDLLKKFLFVTQRRWPMLYRRFQRLVNKSRKKQRIILAQDFPIP